MKVLGICHDVVISSASVVVDGFVVSAIAEERLDRRKLSRGFPTLAVQRCLEESGLTLAEIDEIAVAWNPAIELETTSAGYLTGRRSRVEHMVQVPSQLARLLGTTAADSLVISTSFRDCPPVSFVNHYDSHIGAGFFLSPFDHSAIVVMDGRGERQTCLLAMAEGVEIQALEEVRFPHSLGLFYGAITQYLGFKPDSDEWKIMALAGYADADNEYLEDLSRTVAVSDRGTFELSLDYFEFYNQFDRRMFSDKLVERFGPPREPGSEITSAHEKIAAATQRVFEDATAALLRHLRERTGAGRVVLTGGCFMNSVFNGKARELTGFDEVFVPSCPDDSGTSIGAALFVHAQRTKERVLDHGSHNFWGPGYSDEQCLAVARRYGIPNAEVVTDPSESAAEDLVSRRIVGWFQGRMEFGQRALGNRSILLDPRRGDGKQIMNSAIKFREGFRPFAPAVLAERVADYFSCGADTRVPFMEKVLPFRKEKLGEVPAVVHVDGTGRLQTVESTTAPRFHRLIRAYEARTGVPMVLNTSFNLNGEPIVCSPEDALRTFYTCAMDTLYMGNVRITKGTASG